MTLNFSYDIDGYVNNSIQFNAILYFNVLTQQLQEPIAEWAQEDEIYTLHRKR
jgi:hypothetical protein